MKEVIEAMMLYAAQLGIDGDVLQLETYSAPGATIIGHYIGHTENMLCLEQRYKKGSEEKLHKARYFINLNQLTWVKLADHLIKPR